MPQFDDIATNLNVIGYDCDLNKFVGQYRSESNPQVLDTGVCTNSAMMSNNCVGVLYSEIVLEVGKGNIVVSAIDISGKENNPVMVKFLNNLAK